MTYREKYGKSRKPLGQWYRDNWGRLGVEVYPVNKKRMIVYPLQLVSKCSVKQKNNNSHLKNISNIYVYKII